MSKEILSVAVMNQLPQMDTVPAESPLFNITTTHNNISGSNNDILLEEHDLLGHLVLRGNANDKDFGTAVNNVLGVKLPTTLQCIYLESLSIRWISPDEWLVICPGEQIYQLEKSLREAVTGHFAIVNISSGQTLLTLSGDKARDVLMKSTPYDVHDNNFPIGKAVTSVFAKSQAVISRKNENTWEIVVRRSFAHYIWSWLQDACTEYN